MFLVIKDFIDKDDKKRYLADSIFRSDNERRIQELRNLGFVGEELIAKGIPEEEVPDEIKEEPTGESEKKTSKKK